MGDTLAQLLEASLSSTSLSTYRRPWFLYSQFSAEKLHLQGPIFPISTEHFALFIALLAEQKYAASTVLTYISAFGFPHRLTALPDLTNADIIQLALRGYSKRYPSRDCRLPISLSILENIIFCLCTHTGYIIEQEIDEGYVCFRFFAALRAGEITCQPNQTQRNLIFLNQVAFIKEGEGGVTAIKLTLRNYKHSNPAEPVDIFIYKITEILRAF